MEKEVIIELTNNINLPLKQKEIISAGNVIFQITPIEDNKLEIVNVSRKELNPEPKQIFDPSTTKEVLIGREKNCNFAFPKDKSFSRKQTTFEYDEENKEWVIIDGTKNKPSTNGTWVFGTHSFEIKDEMTVEILTSKVKFNFEKKSN